MHNARDRLQDEDLISPVELLSGLWKQKVLIILVALVFAGGALAYALTAKPVYEARVMIQPPTQNDISQLNYGRGVASGLNALSVKDVYQVFLSNLRSESLRRAFFEDVYLPSLGESERNASDDQLFRHFQDVLTVEVLPQGSPDHYAVKLSVNDPRLAVDWVVRYVDMAGLQGKSEIILDATAEARMKAKNLLRDITVARESARTQREDQIIQLQEALRIARSAGLQKPPIIAAGASGEVSAAMGGALMYMRGAMALEAEIKNLQERVSDDPFVPKLRQRQEAADFYGLLEIDPERVKVYRQDGGIESPEKPVRPRKLLIVMLGLVVGLTLGISVAFFRSVRWAVLDRKLT